MIDVVSLAGTHEHALQIAASDQMGRMGVASGDLVGLLEHDHGLAAYCPGCDAWRVLPLGEWVSQGKGSLHLPLRVRCRDCGERGSLQVRPPMPTRSIGGWITPP
jgi:hypothetical protein